MDIRVRTGKVDILHGADRQLGIIRIAIILNPIVIHNHNFPGFTSRIHSAPITSKAQVSDETTTARLPFSQ